MKRRANLFALAIATFFSFSALAQNVTGVVSDAASGEPVPSVSVKEKGTNNAAITNFDGKYSIKAGKNAVLVFSSMGYASQEGTVSGNTLDVSLSTSSNKLDEVVITAFGISRDKKSIGYAVQEVGGAEVSKVKDVNFMSSLSGKVAGVNIRQSGTMGGSANVVIRGYSSLTGNNQALFVVDGIPISNAITNTSNQQTGRGGYDYGNAAMDINPEDIDKVSVLKGAAATALYGSRASNGVILITTKKGSAKKGLGISIGSGYTVGTFNPSTFVRYQNEYGQGYGPYYGPDTINGVWTEAKMTEYDVNGDGVMDIADPTGDDASYGMRFDPNLQKYGWNSLFPELSTYQTSQAHVAGANDPTTFWETAVTTNNSVAVDGGSENGTFRVSATQFRTSGISPNSSLKRNNFSFNGSQNLSDRLTVSTTASYINQSAQGRMGTGYSNKNPNQSFRQWYNVGVDMQEQKAAYEATGKNLSWNAYGYGAANPTAPHYFDNPYFMSYENYSNDSRDRIMGNIMTNYKINDWLDFMGRASVDTYSAIEEERQAVSGVDVPGYIRRNRSVSETNIDLVLTANKNFGDFSFNGNLGSNVRRNAVSSISAGTNGGLVVPGVYALSNSTNAPAAPSENAYQVGVNGLFARASLGYKDYLYVDLTGRQDVSSTLPSANNSFFYPSATLSLVFSELLDADVIDFGKFRANYAQVGADAPAQALANAYNMGTPFGSANLASAPNTNANASLLPESTTSTELGLEMMLFDNRVGFDLSYYDQTSSNQIMPARVSSTTGSIFKYVNAGVINNAGIEASVNLTPVRTKDFEWNINVNYTRNRSQVVSLFEGAENLQLAGVQGGITIEARPGQAYGVIYGTSHERDAEGRPIVYDNVTYSRGRGGGVRYLRGEKDVLGDINPDWYGGLNNSFRYKNWTASALLDMQWGGSFFSLDTYYGYATGVYDLTAGDNADGNPIRNSIYDPAYQVHGNGGAGGLKMTGVSYWDGSVDADGNNDYSGNTVDVDANGDALYGDMSFYSNVLGYSRGVGEYHVWDASYIKLREVALQYSVPSDLLGQTGIKGLDISLVGRNLAILWKANPYSDPEAGLSAGNIQGNQSGAYPSVREVGIKVNLKF